ncbi:MAG: NAD(P)-dependent alcohol dehydrogenase [Candidatus Omnitrophota bacterium]
MIEIRGYGAQNAKTDLKLITINRRDVGKTDVQIEILYCGVCHSDIHQVRNEWHNTTYPCVPGHEIIGRVVKTGSKVKKFKSGDIAAVGCLVDSCRKCPSCKDDLEQHCDDGPIFTYNSSEKQTGGITYGGYTQMIVVDEDFVLRVPPKLDLAAAAPLLCAGITTYSPLRRWGVKKGQKVGIVGLGGLGHMGVKFANALGARVVLFTTSPDKKTDAKRLGAHDVVISKNQEEMDKHTKSFDFILDTVSADHDINVYLTLLKRSGTMVLVGAPEKPLQVASFNLIMQRRQLAGSLIGGLKETQEMLDFCGKHKIVCDIEKIPVQKINEAYTRILKSDVKYRFVIDMGSLSL